MNDHLQRKKRLQGEWLLTVVFALTLLAALVFADLVQPLGNVLYDHLMRLQGFRSTQKIVVVAIDDRSIQELGGWPIQRHEYAKLLSQLNDDCCRPKAIGFDLLFLDSTNDDEHLASQLKKHNSILPLAFNVAEQSESVLQATPPVTPIAESAKLAHINLSFDADGVIRGFHAKEQAWQHFSLAMHNSVLAPQAARTDLAYYRFRMVDPRIGFPMISFADAIRSKASRTLLQDKYVLIGVTAPSLGDRYPTLYSGKNSASTPGVAILASVLNASLNNALIEVAPSWVVFAVMLLPLMLMLQGLLLLTPRFALVLAAFITVGAVVASFGLLSYWDYWIDPIPLIVIVLLLQPLWAWRRLEAIVHFVQDKAADLRQFQPSTRARKGINPSREVVLQNAKLLDHAVASAHSELLFLAAVVDEIPDSVLIFDAQERLLLCNNQIKTLFSTHDFAEGSELSKFAKHINLAPSLLSAVSQPNQTTPSPTILQLETSLGKRDFVIKTTRLNSQIKRNFGLLIFQDVTELKRSQTQRDRALQFLSHDMRTPVASILSITRQAPEQDNSAKSKITHHANALLNMMDDFILTISAEATNYTLQHVLLDNLINDALAEVFDLANAKSITLKDESNASDIFITANTRLLLRAFINLLYNAVKFSPTKSVIKIQTSSHLEFEKQQVLITITNDVAVARDVEDLTPSMPGFGLGLDFVDNVIHKHNGVIQRDIPAQGVATIRISLPCELTES